MRRFENSYRRGGIRRFENSYGRGKMRRFENFELLSSAKIEDAYVGRSASATLGLIAESKEDVISELLDILETDISDGEDYITETIESIREVLNAKVDSFGKDKVVIY